MPQIAKRPLMAAHNDHPRLSRQAETDDAAQRRTTDKGRGIKDCPSARPCPLPIRPCRPSSVRWLSPLLRICANFTDVVNPSSNAVVPCAFPSQWFYGLPERLRPAPRLKSSSSRTIAMTMASTSASRAARTAAGPRQAPIARRANTPRLHRSAESIPTSSPPAATSKQAAAPAGAATTSPSNADDENQGSGIRDQGSGIRGQGSEVKDQKTA